MSQSISNAYRGCRSAGVVCKVFEVSHVDHDGAIFSTDSGGNVAMLEDVLVRASRNVTMSIYPAASSNNIVSSIMPGLDNLRDVFDRLGICNDTRLIRESQIDCRHISVDVSQHAMKARRKLHLQLPLAESYVDSPGWVMSKPFPVRLATTSPPAAEVSCPLTFARNARPAMREERRNIILGCVRVSTG